MGPLDWHLPTDEAVAQRGSDISVAQSKGNDRIDEDRAERAEIVDG